MTDDTKKAARECGAPVRLIAFSRERPRLHSKAIQAPYAMILRKKDVSISTGYHVYGDNADGDTDIPLEAKFDG